MGVFGVPLAHEDDPERAVRAALRIIEDIGASDLGIEVRIGVNTGEALVRLDVDPRSGEGFATGDTMNTAARLEAAAPLMGVAVGEATSPRDARMRSGTRTSSDRGQGQGRTGARLARARSHRPSSARPNAIAPRSSAASWSYRCSSSSSSGPARAHRPSSSRSWPTPVSVSRRLVRELAATSTQLPELVTWREGRCLPYGDGIGFWALGEIVKAQAGILETDDQTDHLRRNSMRHHRARRANHRRWMKDRLGPLVGSGYGQLRRRRTRRSPHGVGSSKGSRAPGPTVLIVEDLHWADDAFVRFLMHLAGNSTGLPILLVVTTRPEIEDRHPSWLARARRSTVLSLSPLDEAAIESMIASSISLKPRLSSRPSCWNELEAPRFTRSSSQRWCPNEPCRLGEQPSMSP